ncbi:TetR/AcrR family transcriptional regulator [Kribbella sp. NPDC051587]|uniref:TetR/AcrR family transcriptional regulator n=1 Tax=Kribbella sp. NPDC051587 TaxID=3364119 RepID=UPI00378C47E8
MYAPNEATTPGTSAFWTKRSEIVAIAAELFDHEGYTGTNMQTIAESAGLHKPTLYHYFQSKSELLTQIHNDFMQLLFDQLDTIPRDVIPPEDRLRSVVEHIVALMKTHRSHVRTFFEHYRELPPEHRQSIRAGRQRYEAAVVEMITDGRAQGTFRSVNPHTAAMVVFGSCNWAYHWFDPTEDDGVTSDIIWSIIWNGLKAAS